MLTQEKYNKLLPFVWVCKERRDINKICNRRMSYRFCKDMPEPVSNPNMCWQKPLFEELRIINETMMRNARNNIYENRGIF